MNQIVDYKINADPVMGAKVRDHESLLGKIVACLKSTSTRRPRQDSARVQHQSFMDENLLDDVMGPEISRTLRR